MTSKQELQHMRYTIFKTVASHIISLLVSMRLLFAAMIVEEVQYQTSKHTLILTNESLHAIRTLKALFLDMLQVMTSLVNRIKAMFS